MKTYKLLKYQDKEKGTMELKSEVPDFKKNKTHNTFTGQFTEEKKILIETKYFKNNSAYIVQGKN